MTHPHALRWPLYAIAAACACVALTALAEAGTWYGHPIGGMLVDPGGVVSNIGLPAWEGKRQGLHFPNRVLAVDGRALSSEDHPRAEVWDRAVVEAWVAGRDHLNVLVETETGPRGVVLHVHPLEPLAWWVYAGSLLLSGVLYVAAGFTAAWVSPRSPLARTFMKVALATGLMCITMFDFHSTRTMGPLFLCAFAAMPVTWVMLGLRLPDDAPLLLRFPWIEHAADGLAALAAAAFLGLHFSGHETRELQSVWTPVLGGALAFFGVCFFVRFFRAEGVRRARLRALLVSVFLPYGAIGALVAPALRGDSEVLSYACIGLFPLATAYAFIRYDLWGSRALLSRILTRVAVGSLACTIAVALGAGLSMAMGVPFGEAFVASALGGVAAAVLVVAALAVSDRQLFSSRLEYKPTVAQLSEELIAITSPEEVATAVERTIRRWLPCELVEVVLTSAAPSTNALMAADTRPDQLTLPIEFGGARLGSLRVGDKAGNALFTQDDVDLLQTIVNQGALALAHAQAYQELESRRREQAAAWRGERAALVETVAAEVAHEIRYPINFFRSVFDRKDETLDSEELEIGREEVDRLERLVSGLRRLAIHRIERRNAPVRELCRRTETLLRDELGDRSIQLSVPEGAELHCDPDQILQILVNLVANGLQAAGSDGSVGIQWARGAKGTELSVWDTGPGFEGEPSILFAPWYTTKPKGTGLGLAIAHRFVRAHGWSITAQRRDDRTTFIITVQAGDVVLAGTDGDVEGRSTKVA